MQRRDWQSPSRGNVPVVQRRPVGMINLEVTNNMNAESLCLHVLIKVFQIVPERSHVAPNTGYNSFSDQRETQGKLIIL